MAKQIELRRHTDNDGDVLTREGIEAAVEIGRGLAGTYAAVISSGAQRATQTGGCLLAGLGKAVEGGVAVETGLRSEREDDWRAAYSEAGAGDLESLQAAAPDLVAQESAVLAEGLRRIFDRLGDGETALAVGHSPTSEAGVYGLNGEIIEPLGKGEGVLLTLRADGTVAAERLG